MIIAPILTAADRRAMVARGLSTCPDLGDDEAVIAHLHGLGLSLTQIDADLAGMIDEARANAKPDPFVSLGDAAAAVVGRIDPSN